MHDEKESTATRGCTVRTFAWMFIILLWAAVGLTALEFYARWRAAQAMQAATALEAEMMQRSASDTARLCEELGLPPVQTGNDIVARDAFARAAPDERAKYAAERGEAVFTGTGPDALHETYLGPLPPVLQWAADTIAAKGDVAAPLGPQESADAGPAFAMAAAGQMQFREYPLEHNGEKDVAQFTYHPLGNGAVGVFVRPSMWQELWFSFRPGVMQDDAYRISINSHGFRDREVVLPKPAGLYRIVCVGGSTTAEGPTNDLTYPKFLEHILRNRYGAERIEVINAGVFASTAGTELRRVEQYLAMQPDLLLHFNLVNDLTNNLPQWAEERMSANPPLALAVALGRRTRAAGSLADWAVPTGAHLDGLMHSAIVQPLMTMAEQASKHGVETCFASFAAPEYMAAPEGEKTIFDKHISGMHWGRFLSMQAYCLIVRQYNTLLERTCQEQGHAYLPLAENFRRGADVYTDICHMTPRGNYDKAMAMADLLAPLLEAKGLTAR